MNVPTDPGLGFELDEAFALARLYEKDGLHWRMADDPAGPGSDQGLR